MKFQLLIKTKMLKNILFLPLKLSDVVVILLINVKMSKIVGILTFISRIDFMNCWHFNIYKQDKFDAQLS